MRVNSQQPQKFQKKLINNAIGGSGGIGDAGDGG
jgi:hypothetical protein